MGFMRERSRRRFCCTAAPQLVRAGEYTTNYIARVDQPELAQARGFGRQLCLAGTRDIAPSGVLGDPTAATAENGGRWVNEASARIAEILVAMYNFEPRHGA